MPFDVSEVLNLAADLDRAHRRVGRDAAAVVKATARKVEIAMRAAAPVGTEKLKPGEKRLRDSIDTRFYGNGSFGRMTAVIRAGTDHGYLVEDGTSRTAPRPFAKPAVSANEAAFVESMAKLADKVV